MKRKTKFIFDISMVLLMVIGCLSYRSVHADNDTVNFKIDSGIAGSIEGGLVVDLYYIADIEWDGSSEQTTYRLKTEEDSPFKETFDGLDVGVDKEQRDIDPDYNQIRGGQDLFELANTAAGIIFGEDPKTITSTYAKVPVNTDKTVSEGLYLAILRSGTYEEDDTDHYLEMEDDKYGSFAPSYDTEYVFSPYLVFVKSGNASAIAMDETDEEGGLVMLKYETRDRLGLLEIIKHVTLGGQKATVVFRVLAYENKTAYEDGAEPFYEKVLALDIENAGEYRDDSLVLDDIPVGSYVIVREEYAGASYELYRTVPENPMTITPIEEDEEGEPIAQTWQFYNRLNDKNKKGYGVVNTVDENGITPSGGGDER